MIHRRPLWIVLGVVAALLLLVFGAVAWVESDAGRQWIERKASDATGREISIGGIDIKLGWKPGIRVSGLRITNPEWAKSRHLVDTEYIDARFRLLSLLYGRPVVEDLALVQARIGVEREKNRNTWTFLEKEEEQEDKPFPAIVRRINIDRGYVYFRDTTLDTTLEIDVAGGVGGGDAIDLNASGTVRGQATRAVARLPGLLPTPDTPVEMSAAATIGDVTAAFAGIVRAADVDGIDVDIDVSGASLGDLKRLAPVNLPDTPPYRLLGRFRNPADAFIFENFEGRVGDSDLSGNASYSRGKRPVLKAKLTSTLLDLDDLGPAVGAPPKTAPGETAAPKQKQQVKQAKQTGKVLPQKGFKVEDWPTMDADVQFEGKRIVDAAGVPIENLSAKWILKDGVLRFEPLSFTIAGGKVNATVNLDGNRKPAVGKANIVVSGVNLSKLVPATSKVTEPLGTLYGRVNLTGNGTSVAELFGSANGRLAMLVNGGLISNLLVELGGLDVAESLRILATRDVQVKLRCAVADLSLKDGLATPQVLIIDTTDTIVEGKGTINFKTEALDLVTSPVPKDPSPFALRSPIMIRGTLMDPQVRPKVGPIAARAAAALLLAAANPLLAIAPFIETGPGEDSDCGALMQGVKSGGKTATASPQAK
jgi:AsmA family protein